MRKFYSILTIGVVVFFFFVSCNNRETNRKKQFGQDTLLSKTVFFPEKLLELDGERFQKIDSFLNNNSQKAKIVSIIDGTCMRCIIFQLNRIDSIFNSLRLDNCSLVFVLNVNSTDSAYFMRNLQPAINTRGTLLWDNAYHFEIQNKLLTSDPYLRTFMINEENKIVLYGNPIMNPRVIHEYDEMLRN